MTNYEILNFLADKGGYYTRTEMVELLKEASPDEIFSADRLTSLRGIMVNSSFIKYDSYRANTRTTQLKIKVISVEPAYERYSGAAAKTARKRKGMDRSWLNDEKPVAQAIRLLMLFNKLILEAKQKSANASN
ncbi:MULTISPECIES: hypothetical protein [Yersinia]|uniref:Uncharacterized protein n=1 Tax=Yersinia frederiksenii TaxID=29484 RepID=A0AAI9EMR8_YERFR|nr:MULTISPECIES: hypothetical protein [Yersinia]MDN0126895.1 hypothetical protein [Yersinia massiliensis]CFQ87693.1 Uncharacterised protein [Yersinia frederiksenii]